MAPFKILKLKRKVSVAVMPDQSIVQIIQHPWCHGPHCPRRPRRYRSQRPLSQH